MNKLIIICGLPFAGKSTLGKAIAKKFAYETVDVDVTKENLFGKGFKDDEINQEQWVKIYDETDKQIENYLKEGKTVVDDSRNFRNFERINSRKITKRCSAALVTIYVRTPEQIVRKRLIENRKNQTRHDLEDKDFEELLTIFEQPNKDENPIVFSFGDSIEQWITTYTSRLV